MQVFERCKRYEAVGAFGVEIEVVPAEVTAEISKHTNLFLVSMGGGTGGDCQYLFGCDVLGTNTGHVPRHAKQYANLAKEFERIQEIRISAFKSFTDEVRSGAYPEAQHIIGIKPQELAAFKARLPSK
jgi:3-methyl-2-oxobutanoate hydroxymethyltransferase